MAETQVAPVDVVDALEAVAATANHLHEATVTIDGPRAIVRGLGRSGVVTTVEFVLEPDAITLLGLETAV